MAYSEKINRAASIRRMFGHIARRYDRANRWMTWWQDVRWRREVIDRSSLPEGGRLLDIGVGTGDLAREALRRDLSLRAVGADFAPEMMQVGRRRKGSERILWTQADALTLPFEENSFDALVSGYLLRNVVDVNQALKEQQRVLKPGGTAVHLDTTPLPGDVWHLAARLYTRFVIPILGGIIAGDFKSYAYLPRSTERFLTADRLKVAMEAVGFRDTGYHTLMGGTMAIHWGRK